MRILLTGGTGLLGAHFLRRLGGRHEVHSIARSQPDAELEGLAEWVTADLAEPLDRTALPDAVDSVVHLAQSERYRDLPEAADHVFAVNVASTFALLDHARGAAASSFVLASSGGVYRHSSDPLREEDPLEIRDFYFRSKRISEELLEGYSEHFRTVALRPFFIYGPGTSDLLIPRLVSAIRAGEPIRVNGERGLRINPVYVADAAAALEAAVTGEATGVVNIAGPEEVSISELVALIAELDGAEALVEHDGEEPGALLGDISRMRSELGTQPEVGLREGLATLLGAEHAP